MTKKPATIRDVAAVAGVSIKTVSRILNQEPNVSPDTQAKVLAAVTALEYAPNTSAQNLSRARAKTIGLLYAYLPRQRIGGEYISALQTGALAVCEENAFGLMLMPVRPYSDDLLEQVSKHLRKHRVHGVIVTSLIDTIPGLFGLLDSEECAHVCVNANDIPASGNCVVIDDEDAAYRMVRHILSFGHRRVAFISGLSWSRPSKDRYAGFMRAMREAKLKPAAAHVKEGDYSFESGKQAALQLLTSEARPTAIFACGDAMAVGAMHAAYELGLRLPDDLSVAGFDDTELAVAVWPQLTTVHQPLSQMAAKAAQVLIERPNRDAHDSPAQRSTFECEIVQRGSVGLLVK